MGVHRGQPPVTICALLEMMGERDDRVLHVQAYNPEGGLDFNVLITRGPEGEDPVAGCSDVVRAELGHEFDFEGQHAAEDRSSDLE